MTEYLTYPYRTGNTEKINVFFEFLTDCNVQIYPINISIAKKAAHIRARYKDFKTMDISEADAALCLNWFNPLVWLMAKCLASDLETACDESGFYLYKGMFTSALISFL